MRLSTRWIALATAAFLCLTPVAQAVQADDIVGVWMSEGGKGRVEITKKGSVYSGRITWLAEPDYPKGDPNAGEPKRDLNNPDEELRDRPIVGLTVLKDFEFDGEQTWTKGTIYDPENGKTYKCKITMQGDEMHVRGYIGISLIGRTTVWKRYVEPEEDEEEDAS